MLKQAVFFFIATSVIVFSQQDPASEPDNVMLSFRYRPVGDYYINAAEVKGKIYLPMMELFNLFEVYYKVENNSTITGNYFNSENPFLVEPALKRITVGSRRSVFKETEFFSSGTEIYLSPAAFKEIFDLTFTVNMNRLDVTLEENKDFPVIIRKRNEEARKKISYQYSKEYYPLTYDRHRSLVSGTFLDYNITGSYANQDAPTSAYTVTGGAEVLGGDFQGTFNGIMTHGIRSNNFGNVRWRYAVRENSYFSSFTGGQLLTTSVFSQPIRGARISNEPIEPRTVFDYYNVDGYTDPESDVELYLNDRLINVQRSNSAGYYNFRFPLTYGTMRLMVKTYSQYGDIKTEEKQLQVPYTFMPQGVISYNAEAGIRETQNIGTVANPVGNANLIYGITNWLTAKAGAEETFDVKNAQPSYYGSISARLFSQYVLNLDIVPDAYYRANTNVLFPGNAGAAMQYTKYSSKNPLLSVGANQAAALSFYFPLSSATSMRFSGDFLDSRSKKYIISRTDLATRLGDVNIGLNYRMTNNVVVNKLTGNYGDGIVAMVASYTIQKDSFFPEFLNMLQIRSDANYNFKNNKVEQVSLQFSETFLQNFRFSFGAAKSFYSNSLVMQAGIIMDLDVTRSSSLYSENNGGQMARQSFYGSLGVDHRSGGMMMYNRDQVGRGGLTVLLFVDNNGNGKYDKGDEIIRSKGISLDGTGQIDLGNDGLVRITQLQSYYRYNLSIRKEEIDPTLVPTIDKFSFVADPNQFKRIEIPFYRGSIVEGSILIDNGKELKPLGGMRVYMVSVDRRYSSTLRSFADGGFYELNVPPGTYTLQLDTVQLKLLQAKQKGPAQKIIVHSKAGGDMVEGIELVVESVKGKSGPEAIVQYEVDEKGKAVSKIRTVIRLFAQAQWLLYDKQYEKSLETVNESIGIYPTAAAFALKGSIYYVMGDFRKANENWDKASGLDPRFGNPATQKNK